MNFAKNVNDLLAINAALIAAADALDNLKTIYAEIGGSPAVADPDGTIQKAKTEIESVLCDIQTNLEQF